MSEKQISELPKALLRDRILRHMPEPGRLETALPGIALTRYDCETAPEKCLCSPMAALVVQGFKHAFYGERETNYGPGQCVVLGIDLPGVFQVVDASPTRPFLSMSIRLDNWIIAGLLSEAPALAVQTTDSPGPVQVADASGELLDAFNRLLLLLDTPERIPVFAPMLMREIHFYLLEGSLGGALRLFSIAGTKSHKIAQAIAWLRAHFSEPLQMETLARRVNMASSTFNRYFREVTSLSPLQFQKRLRLYEAQRLMFREGQDACSAATAVGYESSSQFTREYKRLFGAPPRQDIERKRH